MEKSHELGTARIPVLLARFSVPAIVGMMVQALYNIVDRIFIGQGVGPMGIAGATIAFPLMLIQMAFSMLIGLGATSLISINLGAKHPEKAESVLGNAFVLLIAVAAVMSIGGFFLLDRLLRLFGASDTVLPFARAYTEVILLGTIFQSIAMGMNNFISGEGKPRTAMATMLIGALLNTILDPLFIFGLKLGVAGAAWATIISQAVSSTWVLSYYLSGRSRLKIRLRNLVLNRKTVLSIMAIGSAPFAMQLGASLLNAIVNNQLTAYGGDLAVSAMGIVFSVSMLFFMPIFGINQGAQPIIGYNYGARNYGRMMHTVQIAAGAATAIMIVGFAVIQLAPRIMVSLFAGSAKELSDLAVHAIRIYFLMMPLIGFQIVAAGYFQAVGKPRQAMFLSLSRQIIVLIPLFLILPRFFGLDGIWFAPPVSDLISALLTGTFFYREWRSFRKGEPPASPSAAEPAAAIDGRASTSRVDVQ